MSTLLIRADAGPAIGSGHLMRCQALAQAWEESGGSAIFVDAADAEPGSAPDADRTIGLAREHDAAWVAIDGYHFDARYQCRLKESVPALLAIDDQGNAGRYCADVVLNQNLHADASLYRDRAPDTRLLLGPHYALLRREFRQWRQWSRTIAPRAKRVLVTLGGADPANVTLTVIEALRQMSDVEALIVVGAHNPHAGMLAEAVRGTNIRLERNVISMAELMAWADVAVSAAGSTCWELAFMGLPALVMPIAKNQQPVAERLDAAGVAIRIASGDLLQILPQLMADEERRETMSRRGRALVDGEGARRVVDQLTLGLSLRPVREDDCRLLWEWTNDPAVRAASFSSDEIAWEEHAAWFRKRTSDPRCLMFIAVDGETPVGQIRYDIDGETAVVSISVAPSGRGRGYGTGIIRAGSEELFAATHVSRIVAWVKPDNAASVQSFRKAGYAAAETTTVRGLPAHRLTLTRGPR
jgi:UDP-2,4-diacetamido-2,4,6-trideoxy-beta-L-altropyranose hydrolase